MDAPTTDQSAGADPPGAHPVDPPAAVLVPVEDAHASRRRSTSGHRRKCGTNRPEPEGSTASHLQSGSGDTSRRTTSRLTRAAPRSAKWPSDVPVSPRSEVPPMFDRYGGRNVQTEQDRFSPWEMTQTGGHARCGENWRNEGRQPHQSRTGTLARPAGMAVGPLSVLSLTGRSRRSSYLDSPFEAS